MKKTILFGMLVVFFGGLLGATAFAGAPPSVGGPAGEPGRPTAPGKGRGAISFELGYYTPSLKTLNDEMKLAGFDEIGGALSFGLKFLMPMRGITSPAAPHPYMGFTYWAGSSSVLSMEQKVTLLSMPIGVEIPILTKTLPETIMLYIDAGGKLILPLWHWEESLTDQYFSAWALGYDIGAKVGGQYFIVPNVFSVGGSIGYTFLGKTGQLTVYDSSDPDLVDVKWETTDGEKLVLELSGITLMFDVRLWF